LRVSIVVPCYQEEAALRAFAPLLAGLPGDEVLFVDDGSTDRTAEVLVGLVRGDPRARVLRHPLNRGVGAAMRTGIHAAGGDVVVVYDADRTYPLGDVARLVGAVLAGADVATASPWARGGGAPGVSAPRRLLSRGASLAYRMVLGPRSEGIQTFTSAFRAWRRSLVRGLVWRSEGFGAAAEMLGLALLEGARVAEVPSTLAPRAEGRSKLRLLPALIEHGQVLGRLARARARGPGG
jgi:dolichol-phosphate mannosyltransferase